MGFVFAAGTVSIFWIGLPAVRWFVIGGAVAGLAISAALGLLHRCKPARPFTLLSN